MSGLLRVKDIVGDKKQGIKGYIPISRSTWYAGVASGRFPKPTENKLGPKITVWRESDIVNLISNLTEGV
jgi:hypothetical protein